MAELQGIKEDSARSKKEKDGWQAELKKAGWVAVEYGIECSKILGMWGQLPSQYLLSEIEEISLSGIWRGAMLSDSLRGEHVVAFTR